MKYLAALLFVALSACLFLRCEPARAMAPLDALSQQAVSPDPAVAEPAITRLRDAGPPGLQALLRTHVTRIATILAHPDRAPSADTDTRLLWHALDSVAQQKDSIAARVYWFTDLEKAKAEAAATNRPILSLRLLGKLNEEFSCANSRFFRTVLYANTEVSAYLRDHFVLHWESVRPAPKITVDFGDGRTIKRTITGNSIHYVLDAQGRPVDGIPGLYGPEVFLTQLKRAETPAKECATLSATARDAYLRKFHAEQRSATLKQLQADENLTGYVSAAGPTRTVTPTAVRAAKVAIGKMAVEMPVVRTLTREPATTAAEDIPWQKIAELHAAETRLDDGSKNLMRLKRSNAENASKRRSAPDSMKSSRSSSAPSPRTRSATNSSSTRQCAIGS